MKFEEILPLLREGKMAKHARMKDGEYWIVGKSGFKALVGLDDEWPTLIKVFKNPFEKEKFCDGGSYSWGIERWAIMCDTWEIVDE